MGDNCRHVWERKQNSNKKMSVFKLFLPSTTNSTALTNRRTECSCEHGKAKRNDDVGAVRRNCETKERPVVFFLWYQHHAQTPRQKKIKVKDAMCMKSPTWKHSEMCQHVLLTSKIPVRGIKLKQTSHSTAACYSQGLFVEYVVVCVSCRLHKEELH